MKIDNKKNTFQKYNNWSKILKEDWLSFVEP